MTARLQRATLPGTQLIISQELAGMLGQLMLDNFMLNSAALTALHLAELDVHAATLRNLLGAYPDARITITGHADAPGPDQHRAGLGQQLADAVLEALVQRGVERCFVRAAGAGASPTLASGTEGRSRRVIIQFNPRPFAL